MKPTTPLDTQKFDLATGMFTELNGVFFGGCREPLTALDPDSFPGQVDRTVTNQALAGTDEIDRFLRVAESRFNRGDWFKTVRLTQHAAVLAGDVHLRQRHQAHILASQALEHFDETITVFELEGKHQAAAVWLEQALQLMDDLGQTADPFHFKKRLQHCQVFHAVIDSYQDTDANKRIAALNVALVYTQNNKDVPFRMRRLIELQAGKAIHLQEASEFEQALEVIESTLALVEAHQELWSDLPMDLVMYLYKLLPVVKTQIFEFELEGHSTIKRLEAAAALVTDMAEVISRLLPYSGYLASHQHMIGFLDVLAEFVNTEMQDLTEIDPYDVGPFFTSFADQLIELDFPLWPDILRFLLQLLDQVMVHADETVRQELLGEMSQYMQFYSEHLSIRLETDEATNILVMLHLESLISLARVLMTTYDLTKYYRVKTELSERIESYASYASADEIAYLRSSFEQLESLEAQKIAFLQVGNE